MKDFLIFIPLTALYLAFKSTVLPTLPLFDLPLIIVFFLAYRCPSIHGVFLAFFLGYLDNIFSASIIGSSSFSLVLIYCLTFVAAKRVHFTNPPARVLGCALSS
ncbi:MAG: hypothetical protein V3T30_07865, partial [Thermodesulfobacteriota bacterium]